MIKEKKLVKINDALSKWHGASAEILDFRQPMSNAFIFGMFKNGEQSSLRLAACQYIKAKVYLDNVSFYCEASTYEGHDCFLLKDVNSDLEIVVGAAIQLDETTVTVSD